MSVIWRDAFPQDLPDIERLWVQQNERLAQIAPTVQAPMPELFADDESSPVWPYKAPVMRVRVAERDGVIIACRVVEAVLEVQLVGGDQEVVASLGKELPEECQWARSKGFRSGWGLAPKELAKPIERALRHTPLRAWPNLTLIGCDFSELGD